MSILIIMHIMNCCLGIIIWPPGMWIWMFVVLMIVVVTIIVSVVVVVVMTIVVVPIIWVWAVIIIWRIMVMVRLWVEFKTVYGIPLKLVMVYFL